MTTDLQRQPGLALARWWAGAALATSLCWAASAQSLTDETPAVTVAASTASAEGAASAARAARAASAASAPAASASVAAAAVSDGPSGAASAPLVAASSADPASERASEPSSAGPVTAKRLALAHALIQAMDTASRQDSMQQELLQMARLGFEQSVQQMAQPPADPGLVWKNLEPRLRARVQADFPAKAWLAAYAKVYAERFDEAELEGMLAFFNSAAGRAYVSRMPLVFSQTLAAQQGLLLPLMDKLQRLTLQALRQAPRQAAKEAGQANRPEAP